ncbi:ribosome biogenesis protein WDR12 homolog [Penaeus japonicus]|uniref:ribosome biogenesis protein WDR12 homolog n=1 Tax=Penaeus japonicus TaxID=27405 RepID=UPI001C712804|nr:ribosome biogenesis protein WDR12 homolog [Penaeus japonicus]
MEEMKKNVDILVKFFTKQSQYAVPGVSVSVPADASNEVLNEIIKTYICQGSKIKAENVPTFDFIVEGQILRRVLDLHLQKLGISFENVIKIEYFERLPPPTPKDSLMHDDWVSSVHCSQDWLLTGCYDNTLHLWDVKKLGGTKISQAHKLTIPAHNAPVKAVTWVDSESDIKTFISTSIDQAAYVWTWDSKANSVECVSRGCGHTQSVECVAVDQLKSLFVTGSWDTRLKIWALDDKKPDTNDQRDNEEEGETKKKKSQGNKIHKMTPLLTMAGHSENVGGVVWTDVSEIASASWDHTVRIWDTDIGGIKSQIVGNCAFFSISWSPLNKTLITGCADNFIRLYDPRSSEGTVCQQKFASHTKWVPSVMWSATNQFTFVSGGFDNTVKQWDSRSPKAPLYDLVGHKRKVLTVDWSYSKYIISGSEDCTVKAYTAKV